MDQRVSRSHRGPAAGIYRAPSAGGGRQNVRKVHGVRAGIHQAAVRIGRAAGLQPYPGLPGRGLQLGGTFYGT